MKNTNNKCSTILVVEDDEDILTMLQELLESEGYHVTTAKNGRDAIETMNQASHPCLILLDLFMPIMDGWQFLDQLKLEGNDGLTQIPIVITSAAGERAKEAAKQVHGYIKKPIDLELLLSTVKKFCRPEEAA